MAEIERRHGVEVATIRAADGVTQASFVPAWGGIGASLRLPSGEGGAREALYQHDFFWEPAPEKTRGGLPFLFPVCGRLERGGEEGAYLYDGRRYHLPIHGFSLRVPWTVAAAGEDRLDLTLRDSEETRAMFPFAFNVTLEWRVAPGRLIGVQRYRNTGDRPLPFYAGFHPFLATPPPDAGKAQTRVTLTPIRRLRYNERLTDIVGEAPALTFPRGAADRALCESLHVVQPGSEARLDLPDGTGILLRSCADDALGGFSFVQCYTIPDRPFFCIEPWMSHPNGLNTVDGARMLPPGGSACTGFEMIAVGGA